MYTFKPIDYPEVVIHYNGDYRGDVEIVTKRMGDSLCYVPFEVLKAFVAGYVRNRLLNSIENQTADEVLLRYPVKP